MAAWPAGSLLQTVALEDRDRLLGGGQGRLFQTGEDLMRAGEPGNRVLVLVSGWVRVAGRSLDGREVGLAYRTAGDVVGELAVLDGGVRSATVSAATVVHAVMHRAQEFLALLDERPALDRALRNSAIRKLRESTLHRIEITGAPVRVRVAHVLDFLGQVYGRRRTDGSVEIDLPISQADIAALIGASDSSVERALAWLRNQALIDTSGYRHPLVRRPGELAAIASRAS
ncbi:Crp/Fnr family transcriptional regulator [Kineosporia babensis]|uniref:Crp/Fnr family transcriptional regulator n=1 Tax=Kineosporia babensis TaxID=499548 RepID=A0A9X1NBF8_9ACTN|nr:Crp/Fnr family transcriptional regulator [Kineosporia babensis]